MKRPSLRTLQNLLFLVALAPSVIVLLYSLDVPMMGLFGDDTIYYSSAQSLAEGNGYRLPSLEGKPHQTKYPPLFPVLLSLAWLVNPDYPANLSVAVWIAWLAVPIYLYLAWRLFEQLGLSRGVGLVIVFVLGWNGQVLLFGSMLMSEIWFSCAVLAAVLAFGRGHPGLAGMLAGLAYLIKSSALPFAIALPVAAWISRRGWSYALRCAVPVLAAVLGWNFWSRGHAVVTTDISLLYNTSYLGYYLQGMSPEVFWNMLAVNFRLLYSGMPQMLLLDPSTSTFEYTLTIFVLVAGAAGLIQLIRNGAAPRQYQYPLFATGYIIQLVAWNFMPTARLLLPVLPLLLAGIGAAIVEAFRVLGSDESMLRVRPVLALITLSFFGPLTLFLAIASFGVVGINQSAAAQENRAALAAKREAYDWIRQNTPLNAGILANDDQLLYLYTRRRSASQIIPATLYYQGNNDALLRAELEKLPTYARERNLDYVLVTSTDLRRENLEKYRPELERIMNSQGSGYQKVFDRPSAKIYARGIHQ